MTLDVQPSDDLLFLTVDLTSLSLVYLVQLIQDRLAHNFEDAILDKLEVEISGEQYIALCDDTMDLLKFKSSDTIRVQLKRQEKPFIAWLTFVLFKDVQV